MNAVQRAFGALMLTIAFAVAGCHRPALPKLALVPQFSLRDQNGHAVTRDDLRGNVWIANFMFTRCPDVCPLLTAKMAGVRGRLVGDRMQLRYVSFSVDPERDTPQALKQYALTHGADRPDWSFLTGPLPQVQRVIVDGFKQTLDATPGAKSNPKAILHGSHFVLIDRALSIRGYYPSDDEGMMRLVGDVRILLAEKAPS
jgi:protein SCO1/2